jgi:hypothetical protein
MPATCCPQRTESPSRSEQSRQDRTAGDFSEPSGLASPGYFLVDVLGLQSRLLQVSFVDRPEQQALSMRAEADGPDRSTARLIQQRARVRGGAVSRDSGVDLRPGNPKR